MTIENTKLVKEAAGRRLKDADQAIRIVLIYAAVALGLSALMTLVGALLDLQMEQSAGLGGMGRRAMLSSLQTMLPWAAAVITRCVELGYQASMLRVARGQYVSPQTLRLGLERFWVLLRCLVLEGLILVGIAIGGIYIASFLFMFTPWAGKTVELLAPVVSNVTLLNPEVVLDEALYLQLMQAMIPAFIICGIVVAILVTPMLYRLRMVPFVIIDKPGIGAFGALRESRKMMKGNCLKLLKLDVSLWWYYAGCIGATLLCYGDLLLSMIGVELPVSASVAYYGFFALYLAAQFAVYYYLRNREEVSYAIAYDAIRPREAGSDGAVLGNIFSN